MTRRIRFDSERRGIGQAESGIVTASSAINGFNSMQMIAAGSHNHEEFSNDKEVTDRLSTSDPSKCFRRSCPHWRLQSLRADARVRSH